MAIPRDPPPTPEQAKGRRAEEVASWYFRVNGFMLCEGYVLHPEERRDDHAQLTEADIFGVRFPQSEEVIGGHFINDDSDASGMDIYRYPVDRPLFILVEVKAGKTAINGPWSNPGKQCMHNVIRRLGFASKGDVGDIARQMYEQLYCEHKNGIIQYVTVGSRIDTQLNCRYPKLRQISFEHIAEFLYDRFVRNPSKMSMDPIIAHPQWPTFARHFGHIAATKGLKGMRQAEAVSMVSHYIEEGISAFDVAC